MKESFLVSFSFNVCIQGTQNHFTNEIKCFTEKEVSALYDAFEVLNSSFETLFPKSVDDLKSYFIVTCERGASDD